MIYEWMVAWLISLTPWLGLAPPSLTPATAAVCDGSDCGELSPGLNPNGLRPGLDPNGLGPGLNPDGLRPGLDPYGLTGNETSTCHPAGNCGELGPGLDPAG